MSERKFQVGDKVRVVSDLCKDYGRFLNAAGEVSFIGPIHKGHKSYLVKFSSEKFAVVNEIRVFEEDMDFIH